MKDMKNKVVVAYKHSGKRVAVNVNEEPNWREDYDLIEGEEYGSGAMDNVSVDEVVEVLVEEMEAEEEVVEEVKPKKKRKKKVTK